MAGPGVAGDATISLDAAFAHATQLLSRDPHLALEQAREIQRSVPGHPQAVLIEGQALRVIGDLPAARAVLMTLAAQQPRSAMTAFELGMVHGTLGETDPAIAALHRAVALKPDLLPAWHMLAGALRQAGRERDARAADAKALNVATRDPQLVSAAMAMTAQDFAKAEAILDQRLAMLPRDAAALRLRGEVAWRQGQLDAATRWLQQTLAIAPGFSAARELLVRIMQMGPDVAAALAEATLLVHDEPGDVGHALLKASLQVRLGEQDNAAAIYRELIARGVDAPRVWLNLGHVEKTLGQQDDGIAAYRRALVLDPALGEAWWSLANLKTVQLTADDIAAMVRAEPAVTDDEQASQLHFALGKAYEDAGDVDLGFVHYDKANRLRRKDLDYDGAKIAAQARERAALFSAACLASRAGQGCPAADPVFIVGLPRTGSTLIEQILSSHS